MTWHAGPAELTQYARAPRALDAARAASLEEHLLGCAACRRAVAEAADPAEVTDSWMRIADVIDRPRESIAVRTLRRLGVSGESVRLVSATTELMVGWLAAVVGSIVVAVWLAREHGGAGPFLVVAPVLPAALVGLVFAPVSDPAGEAGVAAPVSGGALVLRRLVAVEVPAMLALTAASLAVPDPSRAAVAWLLPGLALGVGCLALGTACRVGTAATLTAVTWAVLVLLATTFERHDTLADSALFGPPGQLVALAAFVVGVAVCWRRQDRFGTLEVTW